ncbi:MAG: Fic family protein, partial [Deltaproteobacteria bacterium]|nr:Fic family protein [Deltaproteobacteria bacterium]
MPYQPKFHITPHLLEIIEEISAYRQRIMTATVQVPWVPILQRDARTRTAHSSTAIEGNPLNLETVRALEEGRPVPGASERARREIFNEFAALRFVERHQGKKRIASTDLLRLHTILAAHVMDQGVAGRYRDLAVRVGAYLPPPANQVPGFMKEYLQWWNDRATAWSPVISSAILHYRFEEIHPFGDGNGRMGRAIALWELYRRGFDTHHLFSVDEVYWENRPRYYAQLDAVRRVNGDLTGWLEYTAEALHL